MDTELVLVNGFIINFWLLCVQVAAPGEGPLEAAAGPGQRPVGQQQSVRSGPNTGRNLSHLRETGRATNASRRPRKRKDLVISIIYRCI